jgi:iron complex outermembrane receptor protein
LKAWNYDPTTFAINTGNTLGNSINNDKKIWEDISAAYVQGTITAGKLQVLTGVRGERTDIVTITPLRDNSFSASDIRRYKGRSRQSNSYTDYFPSIHARYEFNRHLIAHASYSTTIGRPNFGDILSSSDTDSVARTVTVANLDLKPEYSRNYDLSLEYYFEPVGVVSVGVFQKNIKDFPIDADKAFISPEEAADLGATIAPGDTTPWTLQSKINGGDARVRGIELSYSQSFTFLPGALRGFGVFANYTYLQTEGTFDTKPPVKVHDLANFIPRTANAGISYAYGRYDAKIQWNYTDWWIESVSLSDPLHRNKIRGDKWQLDASGKFKVTRNISLFADFTNLTSNFGKKFRGYVDPVRREETNAGNFLMTAGLQARY